MIIVLGSPGAGKTTVLSKVVEQLPEWRTIVYGTLMLEIASKRGLVKHRDEMRNLPPEKQSELQAAVGDALAKEKGRILLDTHCSISTPKGYIPGLPYNGLPPAQAG